MLTLCDVELHVNEEADLGPGQSLCGPNLSLNFNKTTGF